MSTRPDLEDSATLKALDRRRAEPIVARADPPTRQGPGPGSTRKGDGELVEAAVRHAATFDHGPAAVMVVADIFRIDDAGARDLFRRFRVDPATGEEDAIARMDKPSRRPYPEEDFPD